MALELEQIALRLEALGNPTRLEIYRYLVRAGSDGLAVGAIQSRTGVARHALSPPPPPDRGPSGDPGAPGHDTDLPRQLCRYVRRCASLGFMLAGGVSSIPAAMAVYALVNRSVFIGYIVLGVFGYLVLSYALQPFLLGWRPL